MDPTGLTTLAAAAALSKPLEKLVDTVRDVMEPGLIVIKAHATAKAKVVDAEAERKAGSIRAAGEAEAADIVARAQMRRQTEEVRQHQNLESIMRKAADALPETVSDQPVDRDWTAHFVDEAKNTSRDEMQELWARLLVGEVAAPGTFSRRLVSLIRLLEPVDARTFTTLCRFAWKDVGPLVWEDDSSTLGFIQMKHLVSLGLISYEPLSGLVERVKWPQEKEMMSRIFQYHTRIVLVESRGQRPYSGLFEIPWGHTMLTDLGVELSRLVEVQPDWDYFERAIKYLRNNGKKVTVLVAEDS